MVTNIFFTSVLSNKMFPIPCECICWVSINTRQDPCFYVVYTKSWPYHLNVVAENKTQNTRRFFFSNLLSNLGELVWIVALVSCSVLTRVAPSELFNCSSTSASRLDMFLSRPWSKGLVISVTVALLSSRISLTVLLWPLATKHFCSENCFSLTILSLSNHSL